MNKICLLLILCFGVAGHLTAQNEQFTIRGKFKNVTEGYTLVMFNSSNGNFKMDTIKFQNGAFSYTGECKGREQRLMMLSTPADLEFRKKSKGQKGVIMFGSFELSMFVQPGAEILLTGDILDFPFVQLTDKKNRINRDLIDLKLSNAKEQKEINRLHRTANEAIWAGNKEEANKQRARMDELQEVISVRRSEWIKNHPDSEYAAYLYMTSGLSEVQVKELQAQYDSFSPAVRESVYGKELAELIRTRSTVVPGSVAPAFTLKNVYTGENISLADYKGKYVILDFWGSWCGPCRASHPHLIRVYDKYKGDRFDILGIAADQQDETIRKAAQEDKISWPQTNMYEKQANGKQVQKLYDVSAFPTKIIIDPEGRINSVFIGDSEKIDEKLTELLGE